MNDQPVITKWEWVKLIVLMNLMRLLMWVQNQLTKLGNAMDKAGWQKIKDEALVPFGLLIVLLIALYVANDASCDLPRYDYDTPMQP